MHFEFQIAERKLKLRFLKQTTKTKTPADDATALFFGWKWRMKGSHFFTVDRSLVGGVSSS
jgi:anti-sigma factor ChrR (cupin superfamily)